MVISVKKILVLCTGNSCRSQIAEGYLRHFAGNSAQIYSAGVETHGVNSTAIAIMAEDGIDISGHSSNNIDEYFEIDFDYIITVCDNAKENCPFFFQARLKSSITIFQIQPKQKETKAKYWKNLDVFKR